MAACTVGNRGKETVVQQLHELFGNVLNLDVIKTVANNCQFDVEASSNQLIELTLTNHSRENTMSVTEPKMKSLSELLKKSSTISIKQTKPSKSCNNSPKRSKKLAEIEQAIISIRDGYKVLVILRGMPGSGKSYLAKNILENTIGYDSNTKNHILSTDDFFMKKGVYQYSPELISDAHGWNQQRAFKVMSNGFSPVIIDNTNTQMWEMKAYATMAIDYGYIIKILEPDTHWCFNDRELSKRNIHNVPKQSIRNMLERYEKNITPQKLLSAYNLKYTLQKPPQLRLYPPPNIVNSSSSNVPSGSYKLNAEAPGFVPSYIEETQNLMDFSEEQSTNLTTNVIEISEDSSSSDENSIDRILMVNGDGLENGILQPQNTSTSQKLKSFNEIHCAWGINEESLRSWDIFTPIVTEVVPEPKPQKITQRKSIELKDCGVNTEDGVFQIIQNFNPALLKDYRIIETYNRDINRYTIERPTSVPKKVMLDKSCLTDEIFENSDVHLDHLQILFPNIPYKYLKYWYEKCKGDLDCTIELILSEKAENLMPDLQETITRPVQESVNNNNKTIVENVKTKRKSHSFSEETLQLKKCIEQKININETHYSESLLKVKHHKNGSQISKPGTSKTDTFKTSVGEVYCVDSDMEFDDIDVDDKPVAMETETETIELNLGDKFVAQLETNFGDPNFIYPKGFQPIVQLPVSLARQLYTFYIESVYQQMEAQRTVMEGLVKEDEEFARKLQENEWKDSKEPTPDFKEIMQEQTEISKHQREVDRWKELTADTLAAKLTREKLFNVFPTIDKDTLVEILHAHNNVYKDTVETLVASTSSENVKGSLDYIKEPPIDDVVLKDMKKAQDSCVDDESKTEESTKEATHYREEAGRYMQKRQELYEKAQQHYQKGMTEVAQFYSRLAAKQTRYLDKANSMAAMAFLDEHSKRLQDFNTIDLHYLFVKEAIPALDVFLDRNINLLRLSTTKMTECLQIITGRGKRSENGLSKIKPAVISRLNKRNIRFITMNPGLLKVKIYKTSLVTSELEMQQQKTS